MSILIDNLFDSCEVRLIEPSIIAMNKQKWPFFAKKFSDLLLQTGVSLYRLDEDTPLRSSNMTKVKAGTKRPTDDILKALANYQPLNASYQELLSWRAIDEYGIEVLKEAVRVEMEHRSLE